ncbi:unnamed protein product [Ranitomeya imitator]|uniref:Reverse transcriptase zinc-binding domain-containing protein n=1 Tax=Ranitomeya imitator TaxID=111125 RepID=A0ABN9MHG3_9NEOB|nr:unnamed protein product [Ranitomeya imitator]CAJ0965027.1 unnamed protein product [Ranitomeya imitator]
MPWFNRDVVRFMEEHQLEGLKPDLWKSKTIQKLIRAKDDVENITRLHQDTLDIVWINVSSDRLIKGHKDLSWMAIQGGLPVRSFMHAWNLYTNRETMKTLDHIINVKKPQLLLDPVIGYEGVLFHAWNLCKTRYCPRCPFVEETSLHTFWDCRFAEHLLTAIEDDLKNSVPRARLSHHSVLYRLFPAHTIRAIQEAWPYEVL